MPQVHRSRVQRRKPTNPNSLFAFELPGKLALGASYEEARAAVRASNKRGWRRGGRATASKIRLAKFFAQLDGEVPAKFKAREQMTRAGIRGRGALDSKNRLSREWAARDAEERRDA